MLKKQLFTLALALYSFSAINASEAPKKFTATEILAMIKEELKIPWVVDSFSKYLTNHPDKIIVDDKSNQLVLEAIVNAPENEKAIIYELLKQGGISRDQVMQKFKAISQSAGTTGGATTTIIQPATKTTTPVTTQPTAATTVQPIITTDGPATAEIKKYFKGFDAVEGFRQYLNNDFGIRAPQEAAALRALRTIINAPENEKSAINALLKQYGFSLDQVEQRSKTVKLK